MLGFSRCIIFHGMATHCILCLQPSPIWMAQKCCSGVFVYWTLLRDGIQKLAMSAMMTTNWVLLQAEAKAFFEWWRKRGDDQWLSVLGESDRSLYDTGKLLSGDWRTRADKLWRCSSENRLDTEQLCFISTLHSYLQSLRTFLCWIKSQLLSLRTFLSGLGAMYLVMVQTGTLLYHLKNLTSNN